MDGWMVLVCDTGRKDRWMDGWMVGWIRVSLR